MAKKNLYHLWPASEFTGKHSDSRQTFCVSLKPGTRSLRSLCARLTLIKSFGFPRNYSADIEIRAPR